MFFFPVLLFLVSDTLRYCRSLYLGIPLGRYLFDTHSAQEHIYRLVSEFLKSLLLFVYTFQVFLVPDRGCMGKHGNVPRRVSDMFLCSLLPIDLAGSQNMILFQTAYPMILCLIYCILAGNTAFVRLSYSPLPTPLIRSS